MFDWLKKKSAAGGVRAKVPPPSLAPISRDVTDVIAAAEHAQQLGDRDEAIALFEQAHRLAPERIYPLYWLATLFEERGELARARECAEKGLLLEPEQVGLMLRFGNIAVAMHDPVAALSCYERVARLEPDAPGIDALLADQYCTVGRIADGVAAFDRAIARDPDSIVLQQNRLFVLNYSDVLAPEALADEHRAWAARHEAPLAHLRPAFEGSRDPDKSLRVGLVSPDLRNHAVAHFVERLLRGHDSNQVQLVCFDTSTDVEDFVTVRLKPFAAAWHRVGALDDEQLAQAIRRSGIDILVDLSGHTKHNRLLTFARQPAPVQMTWLGYLATTGMASIQYRLTDAHMDPTGMTEALHTEELLRMPVQACFAPWSQSPPVTALPSRATGHVTYGALNQWPKASARARDLWARVLVVNPRARLKVIAKGGHTAGMRQLIVDEFTRRGATPQQIEVAPFLDTTEFLRFLGSIDVALDPFPYGGGTTTMHCLWMGVPVVTLEGRTALSRNSIGPLVEVGLGDLVAATPDDYVRVATELARDTGRLDRIRAGLRAKMSASRLNDENAFGRAFVDACRQAWRRYCAASH